MNRIKTILSLALTTSLLAAPALAQPSPAGSPQAQETKEKGKKRDHSKRRGAVHFKKMDANGDGQVTKEEAVKATDVRFSRIDTNGDRVITQQEAETFAATQGKNPRSANVPDKRFSSMDKNGDGKLTLTEVRSAAGARFAKIDTNGDDIMTQKEARTARKARREGHKAKGQAKRNK